MDSRGTHGSLMARDSIREQKLLGNWDRTWTGYSTGEVRTFLEWDPDTFLLTNAEVCCNAP